MDSGIPVMIITLVVGSVFVAFCILLFCCTNKLPKIRFGTHSYNRDSLHLHQRQVTPRPDHGIQRLARTNSNGVNIEVLVSNSDRARNRERRQSRRSEQLVTGRQSQPAIPGIHRPTNNSPRATSSILMHVPTHGIVQSGPNRGMIVPVTGQMQELLWLSRYRDSNRVTVVPVQASAPPPAPPAIRASGILREPDAPPTYEEAMRASH